MAHVVEDFKNELLKAQSTEEQLIGRVVLRFMPKLLEVYAPVTLAYTEIIDWISHQLTSSAAFIGFHGICSSSPEWRGLNANAMLVRPVGRICKYPLLIRELLKCTTDDHPDQIPLQKSLSLLSEFVSKINEQQKRMENLKQLQEVNSRIKSLPVYARVLNSSRTFQFEVQIG